ncbi:Amidase [Caenispirillum salinarum AK4]|uniref:Amidase n=1 Tax=Caenispirillum salinarum AK4 TaxID=1238182 RepID=K9H230_9PROT|nr:amidase family protein [Caenispirillum salinarum]EKV32340.1 Amidase [Caenispirillum salinarum AK4]
MSDDLIRLTAVEAVRLLRAGKVSPLDLVEAALARIAAVDPVVNALPTLCPDRARAAARRAMEGRGDVTAPGWLAGLPLVVKDLTDVKGVRTTYGSTLFAETVPTRTDACVEALEARDGVVLGKSNTPEWGAGANTFNDVFGVTRNPWNTALTCGGSSGGSAVALATGMAWLATGSDLGGSLRTPASFCGIVGLRPSPGRVPRGPAREPWGTLWVEGPMARTVADVALMLDAFARPDVRDPIALEPPAAPFLASAERPSLPRRVAWSPDLGLGPVDPEVADICARAVRRYEDAGAVVEEVRLDLSAAREAFQTLRAASFATTMGPLLDHKRDQLKPEVVWNIEKGRALTMADIARAERLRAKVFEKVAGVLADFDLLACPTAIVPPFPVEQRWVEEVNGVRFDNYVDWLAITFAITLTSCPALSLPAGRTAAGLPVGVQLVGRPRGEAALLGQAALLEGVLGERGRVPVEPVGG